MKTSAEECSEKEVLWNKVARKTVAKFIKPVRKFSAKVTGDAAFLKIDSISGLLYKASFSPC